MSLNVAQISPQLITDPSGHRPRGDQLKPVRQRDIDQLKIFFYYKNTGHHYYSSIFINKPSDEFISPSRHLLLQLTSSRYLIDMAISSDYLTAIRSPPIIGPPDRFEAEVKINNKIRREFPTFFLS